MKTQKTQSQPVYFPLFSNLYISYKGSTQGFLSENKENANTSMTGGMRDVLLMKCKQAIEELHLELEGEKKLRFQVEEALTEAENESQEKDSELREMRYKQEKLNGLYITLFSLSKRPF